MAQIKVTVEQLRRLAEKYPAAAEDLKALAPAAFPSKPSGVLMLGTDTVVIVRTAGCYAQKGWHLLSQGRNGPLTWSLEVDELGAACLVVTEGVEP